MMLRPIPPAPKTTTDSPIFNLALFSTTPKPVVCNYIAKGLKLDSQSFSQSIGDNQTVTLDFTSQIGGPSQKSKGIFMSGYYNPNVTGQQ